MHRNLVIAGTASSVDDLSGRLSNLDGVLSLARLRGASVKPAGDLLELEVLNRAADQVLRIVSPLVESGLVVVMVKPSSAVLDVRRMSDIHEDQDESTWEEVEIGLRH